MEVIVCKSIHAEDFLPVKKECDHIVGCTEPEEDTPWVILLKKSQYKPRLYFLDPFKYCPECGEPIEKQLNT